MWKRVCVAGGHWGVHCRRDGQCSGRYATYWNAFLSLCYVFLQYNCKHE